MTNVNQFETSEAVSNLITWGEATGITKKIQGKEQIKLA